MYQGQRNNQRTELKQLGQECLAVTVAGSQSHGEVEQDGEDADGNRWEAAGY